MAKKITYLYQAKMKGGNILGEDAQTTYFYSRNERNVRNFCNTRYKPINHFANVEIKKVGECKYTVEEPIVEFTDEEKTQIERYFLREMVKYVYIQQQLGVQTE